MAEPGSIPGYPAFGSAIGLPLSVLARPSRRHPRHSASKDQHSKVSWLGCRLRMRLLFGWSGRRIVIRGAQKKLVGLWINLNRSCPELTLDRLNLAEFVRRVFVKNVDHAFSR